LRECRTQHKEHIKRHKEHKKESRVLGDTKDTSGREERKKCNSLQGAGPQSRLDTINTVEGG
jgi:hypothetical protein